MKTDTMTLAEAMDALARDIQSGDGVANAAIAEAAQRLRSLQAGLDRMTENWIKERRRASVLKIALEDAISTYSPDRDETIVTSERQEAWIAALQGEAK